MSPMDRHEREELDRHITGNYGEDQFKDEPGDEVEPPMDATTTMNMFLVSSTIGGTIRVMMAPRLMTGVTADEALNLAAWLVVIAEVNGATNFNDLLAAVRST